MLVFLEGNKKIVLLKEHNLASQLRSAVMINDIISVCIELSMLCSILVYVLASSFWCSLFGLFQIN